MKKAKDLKIPFSWEERRPVILENFFYIPSLYDRHGEWVPLQWSDPQLFGNEAPVILEFCSGNGQWICERAKEHPECNWVALDIRFDRCRKTWCRLHREKLSNLFVICGDAKILVQHYLPTLSLERFYVNFPDPWPKLRHAKHRLIQTPFIDAAAELLLPGKEAIFVTDDPTYAKQMATVLCKSSSLKPLLPYPHYELNPKEYGSSYFHDLWVEKGRLIHKLIFQKWLIS
ncbi:MAG TPA: tRNA (guanine(46)-N(7))-methyltransferase TrmB [Chlamydiales bacterium]|nr:tRNA (guanine(46)-N(7))-methyltransferase TrmB [Chlamydiales bacterium]